MKKILLCLALAVSAFSQTASFPGAIATDEELGIAANNVATVLRSGVTASDTVWVVSDASRIRAYMRLGCEREVVSVASVAGNQVTVVRGFDGTAAAAHTAGRVTEVRPIAWDKNILSAHVKAIEQSLGVGMANVGTLLPGGTVMSQRYDFSAQTPGGSLVSGNNAVTLTPVPFGVSGTNTAHYLYVSGGTGTAEACLINGGAGVSGASSGQIIINCANAHSGPWTIRSATAGIQEGVNAGGSRQIQIALPAGDVNIYAPVTITTNEVMITGQGDGTHVNPQYSSGDVFYFHGAGLGYGTGFRNSIRYLAVMAPSSSSITGIHIDGQVDFKAESVFVNQAQYGFLIDGEMTTSIVRIHHCNIEGLTPTTGIGIYQRGGADIIIDDNTILGFYGTQPHSGVRIDYSTGTKMLNNDAFATGFGLYVSPGSGKQAHAVESVNNWWDSGTEDGIAIVPTGTGSVTHFRSVNDWCAGFSRNGIEIGSLGTINHATFVTPLVRMNAQAGIVYSGGTNISFIGATVAGNSYGSTGTYHGFVANPNTGGFRIIGGTYGPAGEASTQGYGILLAAGTGDNWSIVGASVGGNVTGGIADGSTGAHKIIANIIGLPDLVAVASADSISLGISPIEQVLVTGTTAIRTMTPVWGGRHVRLLFTGSSPGGIALGGNVIGSGSTSVLQFQSLDCTYINANGWSCVGP